MRLYISSLGAVGGGVPEPSNKIKVVLHTGQSNAQGRGSQGDLTVPERLANPDCLIYNPLTDTFDPIEIRVNDRGDGTGHPADVGPDVLYGWDFAARFPDDKLYIIKHGQGGTEIAQHLPGGAQYNIFYPRVKAGINKLLADGYDPEVYFFWSQGERDAFLGRTQAQYYADLNTLISTWKSNLGISTMYMTAYEIARDCYPAEPGINAAINQVGTEDAEVTVINTIDMDAPDGLHFTTAVLRDTAPTVITWFATNSSGIVTNPVP